MTFVNFFNGGGNHLNARLTISGRMPLVGDSDSNVRLPEALLLF